MPRWNSLFPVLEGSIPLRARTSPALPMLAFDSRKLDAGKAGDGE